MRSLSVHFLPSLTTPEELAGGTVVVIDVLRASTTIIHALAAGAKEVIPCLEVEEARAVAAKYPRDTVVLGGERAGLKIDGFDLGNSPREYTPERVGGKTVVFTTTNGTRAMQMCRLAKRVLVGAFVNAESVADKLGDTSNIHLLCAGTDGKVSAEDSAAAGTITLVVQSVLHQHAFTLNDAAMIASEMYVPRAIFREERYNNPQALEQPNYLREMGDMLSISKGAANLREIGFAKDIWGAVIVHENEIVPELDLVTWRITAG